MNPRGVVFYDVDWNCNRTGDINYYSIFSVFYNDRSYELYKG